jgi:CRP-like cAMP-binding protein
LGYNVLRINFIDKILTNVARYTQLTTNQKEIFRNFLQKRDVANKEVILDQGQVCKHSIYVTKGCLRGYTIDENGYEYVLQFAPPDWWIADMYSLMTQQPGQLIIEALEDFEILTLSKTDQESLYISIPQFERFFRIITENSLVTNRPRILDNMSLTAEQRYEVFCKRYPSLIDYLAQKQITAYIRVTPEFFSKMKARLNRDYALETQCANA